jgi:hypothetical protein
MICLVSERTVVLRTPPTSSPLAGRSLPMLPLLRAFGEPAPRHADLVQRADVVSWDARHFDGR